MTSFPKPWEHYLRNHGPTFSSQPEVGLRPYPVVRQPVPPLPPRTNTSARSRFQRYNSIMNGGYRDYGGFYSPYSASLFRQQEFENRYIQMAEESAQPAFNSIEAFIRGFSSVTLMMESTFQAMNMSFRAVLDVAENMAKMRTAIFEFLSAFSVLKAIYSFYRKILYFLGVVNGMEVSWKDAENVMARGESNRPWSILAFLGAIIVGPTLVYKYLLPKVEDDDVELVGIHGFEAENHGELSFAKGDKMTAKRSELKKNWIFVTKTNGKGYVPYNRVGIIPKNTEKPKIVCEAD